MPPQAGVSLPRAAPAVPEPAPCPSAPAATPSRSRAAGRYMSTGRLPPREGEQVLSVPCTISQKRFRERPRQQAAGPSPSRPVPAAPRNAPTPTPASRTRAPRARHALIPPPDGLPLRLPGRRGPARLRVVPARQGLPPPPALQAAAERQAGPSALTTRAAAGAVARAVPPGGAGGRGHRRLRQRPGAPRGAGPRYRACAALRTAGNS